MSAIKSKILYDKTEIIFVDLSGKRARSLNLTYDKVVSIQFDEIEVRKLFKKVKCEKLSIAVRGQDKPLELLQCNEQPYWDQYIKDLTKFAKDNRISFRDNRTQKVS